MLEGKRDTKYDFLNRSDFFLQINLELLWLIILGKNEIIDNVVTS